MIQSKNLTKRFNNTLALDSLTTSIEDGKIYGLVGSNGAGKSTFLRLLAGIYRPTEGRIMINGEDVYENPALKSELFFIPDEIYQMPGASMDSLAKIYSSIYPNWSASRYAELVKTLPNSAGAQALRLLKGNAPPDCDYSGTELYAEISAAGRSL